MLADPGGVGAAAWLLRALRAHPVGQQMEIADAFDDLAHNTSVVLLVTVGSRTLLLPGDAQGASWAPVLADPALARLLAAVQVYKVGGHGSRRRHPAPGCAGCGPDGARRSPLVSVLSADAAHAGPDGARRPRPAAGPVCSTAALPPGVWWLDVEAPAHGRTPFTCSPGAARPGQ